MEYIHELLGYQHIKIVQREDLLRFSLDSMLLADFVHTKTHGAIVDLGCGNAPIPLFLTLKTKAKIVGVELQKTAFDLAVQSVQLNGFEQQITIVQEDIKNVYKKIGANCYTIVTSNPPYFKYCETSNINKNDFLTIARHEVKITLEDIVMESKKLLVDGGSLYMVHRVERFAEIVTLLDREKYGLKRVRFVYPKTNSNKALLVLFEAKKNKPADVVVEQPLFVLNEDEEYTEEVKKIFHFPRNHKEI
jgi:tRNA1Val (adenine37-N6)-methyltransferase